MQDRLRAAHYIMWVGIISNIVLVIIKGLGGWISGSTALLADATNSITDVFSSIAIFVGIRAAHEPPDCEHPYGHGKAETVTAIMVSMLIAFVGLEVGKNALMEFFEPVSAPSKIAIIAAITALVIKEFLYRYTYRLGKKWKSQLIIVTAWDHRADVLATSGALLGVILSMLGEYLEIESLLYFDPIAGLAVSIYVLCVAYTLAKESISQVLDRVVDPERTSEFISVLSRVDGVISVHDLRARHSGHYLIVDVKLSVDHLLTVSQGHAIGKSAKQRLLDEFPEISHVLVHINPQTCPECN